MPRKPPTRVTPALARTLAAAEQVAGTTPGGAVSLPALAEAMNVGIPTASLHRTALRSLGRWMWADAPAGRPRVGASAKAGRPKAKVKAIAGPPTVRRRGYPADFRAGTNPPGRDRVAVGGYGRGTVATYEEWLAIASPYIHGPGWMPPGRSGAGR